MSDLHERFRSLDNVAFPAGLSPRSGPTRPLETPLSGVRRIGIVVLALAIAAVAFGFSVAALRRSHNEVPASQGSTPPAASRASPRGKWAAEGSPLVMGPCGSRPRPPARAR